MKNTLKCCLIISLFLAVVAQPALARTDYLIINSADWRDVYSGLLYSNFLGGEKPDVRFFNSEQDAVTMAGMLRKQLKNILLIESSRIPYAVNYKASLEREGFIVNETKVSNANIELARRINVKKFIAVDDTYGHNTVSIAPYAALEKSWVLFVNRNNIDDVSAFLRERGVDSLMIYGYVDKVVSDRLEVFNPRRIDMKNRFDNGIEVAKMFLSKAPTQQIILSSGEFIEPEMFAARSPVLLVDKDRIPQQVVDFLKSRSDITVANLIGNELVNSVQGLKKNVEESHPFAVFIKFGTAVTSGQAVGEITALDMFPLPKYELSMVIDSAVYNKVSRQLEVLYKNRANIYSFFKSSIGVFVGNERVKTVSDDEAVYIGPLEFAGVPYQAELGEDLSKGISVKILTLYGEEAGALTRDTGADFKNIEVITIDDRSLMDAAELVYRGGFELKVANTGNVTAFARPELNLKLLSGEKLVRLDGVLQVEPGKTESAFFDVELTEEEMKNNSKVPVRIRYGERKEFVFKTLEKTLPVSFPAVITPLHIMVILAVCLILIGIFAWKRRKRKREYGYGPPESAATGSAAQQPA